MANVFEVEANASQDANYREHLNRNWQNGNTEFDKLENWLNALKENINDYQEEVDQVKQSLADLGEQHNEDVGTLTKRFNNLNEVINKQDARIKKLENAVFGLTSADITAPPIPDYSNKPLQEINFDNRKDKSNKW